MQYQTVYELGDSVINGIVPLVSFLVLGVLLFLLGVYQLVRRFYGQPVLVKKRTSIVMVVIGLLWLPLSPTVLAVIGEKNELQALYDAEHYETIEGVVKVLREQPREGDHLGELIEIGGVQFVINFYRETHGYSQTIANGGVLKEGVRARLRYRDQLILKVEVAI